MSYLLDGAFVSVVTWVTLNSVSDFHEAEHARSTGTPDLKRNNNTTKKVVGVAFLFPLKEKKLNKLIGANSLI